MSGSKSNADKENAIRILDYWFLMEFFNQQSIKSFIEIGKKANTYNQCRCWKEKAKEGTGFRVNIGFTWEKRKH